MNCFCAWLPNYHEKRSRGLFQQLASWFNFLFLDLGLRFLQLVCDKQENKEEPSMSVIHHPEEGGEAERFHPTFQHWKVRGWRGPRLETTVMIWWWLPSPMALRIKAWWGHFTWSWRLQRHLGQDKGPHYSRWSSTITFYQEDEEGKGE